MLQHDLDILEAHVTVSGHSLTHIYYNNGRQLFQADLDVQGQMEEEGGSFSGVLEATLERWEEVFLATEEWQVSDEETHAEASLVANEITIALIMVGQPVGSNDDDDWYLQEVHFLNERWTCDDTEDFSERFDIIEGEKSAILESVKEAMTRMYDHVRKQALGS